MKRIKPLFISLCAVSGAFMLMFFLAIVIAAGVRRSDFRDYERYNEPSNYEAIICRVDRIERDYQKNLILTVEPVKDKFYFATFSLAGENLNIAKENGLLDVLEKDIYIKIWVMRNEYDTDWARPIAGLSCNERKYLPFEDGYKNIAQISYNSYESTTTPLIVFCVILGVALAVFVANFIIYFTGKKPTDSDTTATAAATDAEQQVENDAAAAEQPVGDDK